MKWVDVPSSTPRQPSSKKVGLQLGKGEVKHEQTHSGAKAKRALRLLADLNAVVPPALDFLRLLARRPRERVRAPVGRV